MDTASSRSAWGSRPVRSACRCIACDAGIEDGDGGAAAPRRSIAVGAEEGERVVSRGNLLCVASTLSGRRLGNTEKTVGRDAGVILFIFEQVAPDGKDTVLNLLAVEFEMRDAPAGIVTLVFSGGPALRLEVECLEVELVDLGPAMAVEAGAGDGAQATAARH